MNLAGSFRTLSSYGNDPYGATGVVLSTFPGRPTDRSLDIVTDPNRIPLPGNRKLGYELGRLKIDLPASFAIVGKSFDGSK
jgi:hypothetical protein